MLYAKLDNEGNIVDIATSQSEEYGLLVAPNEPSVAKILEQKFADNDSRDTQQMLTDSDGDMMRILEDLIDLLTEKRLIQFTELPQAAQKKLLSRKWVRGVHTHNDESLIADNDTLPSSDGDSFI
ncbi:hypothetical protein [Marinomonas sp. THO17]|uniref:hypothetical protein n=1 Tax=Marinomonas sp. THO17 TaxID=3149048 RepID=UPI00336C078F